MVELEEVKVEAAADSVRVVAVGEETGVDKSMAVAAEEADAAAVGALTELLRAGWWTGRGEGEGEAPDSETDEGEDAVVATDGDGDDDVDDAAGAVEFGGEAGSVGIFGHSCFGPCCLMQSSALEAAC